MAETNINERRRRFREWRSERPFWGGTILIIAGIVIGAIPLEIASAFAGVPGSSAMLISVLGLVFAFFTILSGVIALYRPKLSTIAGGVGIVVAVLSIIGALGGLFLGTILGIIGGSLCIAWEESPEGENIEPETTSPSNTGETTSPDEGQKSKVN
ncbi:MAG: DUF6114 domain-containing protein [Halobacteria archaeon]|nr:DUF6114 domain-containing protein [Halobacteria archaeon]